MEVALSGNRRMNEIKREIVRKIYSIEKEFTMVNNDIIDFMQLLKKSVTPVFKFRRF